MLNFQSIIIGLNSLIIINYVICVSGHVPGYPRPLLASVYNVANTVASKQKNMANKTHKINGTAKSTGVRQVKMDPMCSQCRSRHDMGCINRHCINTHPHLPPTEPPLGKNLAAKTTGVKNKPNRRNNFGFTTGTYFAAGSFVNPIPRVPPFIQPPLMRVFPLPGVYPPPMGMFPPPIHRFPPPFDLHPNSGAPFHNVSPQTRNSPAAVVGASPGSIIPDDVVAREIVQYPSAASSSSTNNQITFQQNGITVQRIRSSPVNVPDRRRVSEINNVNNQTNNVQQSTGRMPTLSDISRSLSSQPMSHQSIVDGISASPVQEPAIFRRQSAVSMVANAGGTLNLDKQTPVSGAVFANDGFQQPTLTVEPIASNQISLPNNIREFFPDGFIDWEQAGVQVNVVKPNVDQPLEPLSNNPETVDDHQQSNFDNSHLDQNKLEKGTNTILGSIPPSPVDTSETNRPVLSLAIKPLPGGFRSRGFDSGHGGYQVVSGFIDEQTSRVSPVDLSQFSNSDKNQQDQGTPKRNANFLDFGQGVVIPNLKEEKGVSSFSKEEASIAVEAPEPMTEIQSFDSFAFVNAENRHSVVNVKVPYLSTSTAGPSTEHIDTYPLMELSSVKVPVLNPIKLDSRSVELPLNALVSSFSVDKLTPTKDEMPPPDFDVQDIVGINIIGVDTSSSGNLTDPTYANPNDIDALKLRHPVPETSSLLDISVSNTKPTVPPQNMEVFPTDIDKHKEVKMTLETDLNFLNGVDKVQSHILSESLIDLRSLATADNIESNSIIREKQHKVLYQTDTAVDATKNIPRPSRHFLNPMLGK